MSFCTFLKKLGKFLLWVVPPTCLLVVVWVLAYFLMPQPAVGIIRLDTDIWSGSAQLVQYQIEAARKDSRVKAVVVQLDTPAARWSPRRTSTWSSKGCVRRCPSSDRSIP